MSHPTTDTAWPPHLVVATVVEQDGKFLLVYERDGDRLVYNQPAGHWDKGESIFDAALRETREESGWEVKLDYLIGQYSVHAAHNDITYYRTAFAATPIKKVSEQLDKEIVEVVWLSYAEIVARKAQLRSPLVLRVIEDYRAGKKFPLDFISHVL